MYYTHNSDLNYYKEHPSETNCGSYALRLNEWYDLDTYFEDVTGYYIEDWINEKNDEGYSAYEISTLYAEILVDGILEDLSEEIEVCDGRAPSTSDVELVAFRTFCYPSEKFMSDYDYHFRVFRDGKWMEKIGTGIVGECNIDEWEDYISDTIYFYHKIEVA